MPFFVYGRNATTGEVAQRFFSEAQTKEEARQHGEARGLIVSAVVPTTEDQRPPDAGDSAALMREAEAKAAPLRTEMAAFTKTLENRTPTTYVTYALIIINILVFIGMVVGGVDALNPRVADLLRWGAEFGPRTANGQWWRLFTSLFVHIGLVHLLYNMLAFAYVAPTVERMVGNAEFLLVYLVAGLGGSLWALYLNPMLVHAGASGAIFGVYGLLLALLLRQRGSIPPHVAANLRKYVAVFVIYNMANSLRPGISLAAHFGGLVAGFACGFLVGPPLAAEADAERPRRSVMLGAVGLVLLGVGAFGVRAKYPNLDHLEEVLGHFDAVEQQSHTAFRNAAEKAKQEQITGAEFAGIIEHDMLPAWRSTRDELATVSAIPSSTVTKVQTYMQLRQDALEALDAALRDGNRDSMEQATAKQQKADKMSSWASAK